MVCACVCLCVLPLTPFGNFLSTYPLLALACYPPAHRPPTPPPPSARARLFQVAAAPPDRELSHVCAAVSRHGEPGDAVGDVADTPAQVGLPPIHLRVAPRAGGRSRGEHGLRGQGSQGPFAGGVCARACACVRVCVCI